MFWLLMMMTDYDGELVHQILLADCNPHVIEKDMKEKSGKKIWT